MYKTCLCSNSRLLPHVFHCWGPTFQGMNSTNQDIWASVLDGINLHFVWYKMFPTNYNIINWPEILNLVVTDVYTINKTLTHVTHDAENMFHIVDNQDVLIYINLILAGMVVNTQDPYTDQILFPIAYRCWKMDLNWKNIESH